MAFGHAGRVLIALGSIACFCGAATVRAEGDTIESQTITGVDRVYLSAQMAAIGRQQQDPILLLGAAHLLAGVNSVEVSFQPQISGGEANPAIEAPRSFEHSVAALTTEARILANGDTNVLAIANAPPAVVSGLRGAGGGPKLHRQMIARGAVATFRADFRGGEVAEVTIIGSHTADLNLKVRDERGTVICASASPNDFEFCRWLPIKNASYYLAVENKGTWSNLFSIYTN